MTSRIYSLDSMRIIAMVFIVLIHTNPFEGIGLYGNMANFVIETSARFAVPFFFMTSGYLFALKAARGNPTSYLAKRAATISSLYVFGILLSFPVFLTGTAVGANAENRDVADSVVLQLIEYLSPLELLYYGTSVSEILWFLPALLFSFVFVYLFIRLDRVKYVLPVAIGFHVVGLLGASYTMFVDVPFEIRDGLFFGFFYTSLGFYLYANEWEPRASPRYLGAIVLFTVLHTGERYLLGYALTGQTFGHGVYSPSYTITTALVSVSIFAFLLSRPTLGKSTPLPTWGKYAVGVYVAHPPVLYVLEKTGEALNLFGTTLENTIIWHLTLTPATFFGALLLYVAAHKVGLIEIGGTHLPGGRWLRNRNSTTQHSES